MRPTDLHFRPPRERTAQYLYPHITHDGRNLESISNRRTHRAYDRKNTTFTNGHRFGYVQAVSARTGPQIGPSSYTIDQHTVQKKPRRAVEFRPLVAGPEPSRGGYVYDGNHLLFDFTALQEYQRLKVRVPSGYQSVSDLTQISKRSPHSSRLQKKTSRSVIRQREDGRQVFSQSTAESNTQFKSSRKSNPNSQRGHIRSATHLQCDQLVSPPQPKSNQILQRFSVAPPSYPPPTLQEFQGYKTTRLRNFSTHSEKLQTKARIPSTRLRIKASDGSSEVSGQWMCQQFGSHPNSRGGQPLSSVTHRNLSQGSSFSLSNPNVWPPRQALVENEVGSSLQATEEHNSPVFEGKLGSILKQREEQKRRRDQDLQMLRNLKEMRLSLEERLLQKGSLSHEERYMLHIIREQEQLLQRYLA